MLSEYLQSYMSFNQYILVCALYVLSTYSMYLNCQTHSEDTMFLLLTMGKDTVCTGQVRGDV